MPEKKPKPDRDEITVAKSIFDELVEWTESEEPVESPKELRAKKGAHARASKLTPEQRKAIAKKAAESRWKK